MRCKRMQWRVFCSIQTDFKESVTRYTLLRELVWIENFNEPMPRYISKKLLLTSAKRRYNSTTIRYDTEPDDLPG